MRFRIVMFETLGGMFLPDWLVPTARGVDVRPGQWPSPIQALKASLEDATNRS